MMTCPVCGGLNPEGSRFCNHCGSPLTTPGRIEGERRIATVLFADVVGSTTAAEQLDPEDWAAVMNGAFAFMNASVDRYGGTVAHLMGDAVLAFFGAPRAHEDDPERSVRAALDMQEAALAYAREVEDRHGITFRVRVGIHTGMSVLGMVGDSVKAEYTAMGDTANTAARLQSAAHPGTILVSKETHRLVRHLFEFEPRGPLEMKGKVEPVEAFQVMRAVGTPGSVREPERLSSPLISREREMEALLGALDGLADGTGRVIAITGEAGLGKSRLVKELSHAAEKRPPGGAIWAEGRAISYGQSLAYYPWQELGRTFIGATPTDGPAAVRDKLVAESARLGLPQENLPLYQAMLAVEDEESSELLQDLQGDPLGERVTEAVTDYFAAAMRASGRPMVIVFDDLHWADAASLDLLVGLAALTATSHLLLVCLLRPDRKAPSWATLDRLRSVAGDQYLQLDLEPLDGEHSDRLIGNLLDIRGLPRRLRRLILTRSEGNPFFIEEVLHSLVDAGHVGRENGDWRATGEIDEVLIPDTLSGVLAARIDSLPGRTREVAQTASVLGRRFAYMALRSVLQAAPPPERIDDVDPHLVTLEGEDMVREEASHPELEYIFKHVMTQETAYGLLLRTRRRELHGRAGLVLESLYPERILDLAPVLAHHFHESGDLERTARYSARAGNQGIRLFAGREAAAHFDRALHALEAMENAPPIQLFDTIMGWTVARHMIHEYDGVQARLMRAESIARELSDKRRIARAISWIGNVYMLTGTASRATPYMIEAQKLATELGDERLNLLPLFDASERLIEVDPRRGAEGMAEVVRMAREQHFPDIEGHALAFQSLAHARLGEFDEARRLIAEAQALAPSLAPVKEADVYIVTGFTHYEMGEMDRGLELLRKGSEMARSEDAPECACVGFFGVGLGELARHAPASAIEDFRRSQGFADAGEYALYTHRITAGTAAAEFLKGNHDAIPRLEQVLAKAREDKDHFTAALFGERLAEALDQVGRTEEIPSHLEASLAYYRETGMKPNEANALEALANALEKLGRTDDAEVIRQEAAAARAAFAGQ